MQHFGSRAQVMHGNAKQTGGGLKKKDLKYNKHGKIVSKKMSMIAKNKMIGGASSDTRSRQRLSSHRTRSPTPLHSLTRRTPKSNVRRPFNSSLQT